jgi:hypothetical protein
MPRAPADITPGARYLRSLDDPVIGSSMTSPDRYGVDAEDTRRWRVRSRHLQLMKSSLRRSRGSSEGFVPCAEVDRRQKWPGGLLTWLMTALPWDLPCRQLSGCAGTSKRGGLWLRCPSQTGQRRKASRRPLMRCWFSKCRTGFWPWHRFTGTGAMCPTAK